MVFDKIIQGMLLLVREHMSDLSYQNNPMSALITSAKRFTDTVLMGQTTCTAAAHNAVALQTSLSAPLLTQIILG